MAMTEDIWNGDIPVNTQRYVKIGLIVTMATLGAFLVWSTTARLDSATVAPGNFTVTGRNQMVQHLDGGVIDQLLVEEGDTVQQGQLLLRLDDAEARAELQRLELRRFRLHAAQVRLQSEIAQLDDIEWPEELKSAAAVNPAHADALEVQAALFVARGNAQKSERQILQQGVAAYREHVAGQRQQLSAAENQLMLIVEDREARETLVRKGLTKRQDFLSVKRAEAQLQGETARLRAAILDGMERILRGEQMVTNAHQATIERAITELDKTLAELRDIEELIARAERAIERLDIRAPSAGVVVKLEVNSPGGVIRPGAKIMELVPIGNELIIEARVRPQDIDSVHKGQNALVRLTALNQRVTPMITGQVIYVSADTLKGEDFADRQDSYIARVSLDRSSIDPALARILTPGMPVELYIKTGVRTFASYLMRPLTDSMQHAFKES
jgi:HlyD family secretion protein